MSWGGARPGAGRPRVYESDAARKAAYKVRRAANPDLFAAYVRVPYDCIVYDTRYAVHPCRTHGAPPYWGYCSLCMLEAGLGGLETLWNFGG